MNDRVDVALASSAGGVHLGQDDFPAGPAREILGAGAVIGVSVRSETEAVSAASSGADYLAANLVFATDTKTDITAPLGLEGIRSIRRATSLPLVAIGGITPENGGALISAGADMLAVISAVFGQADVRTAARSFADLFDQPEDLSP